MWFLIRSAFWLSIVFALLPWPDDSGFGSSPPAAIWSRTRDAIGAALVKARVAKEKICTDSPLACLKAAVRLDQLAADRLPEGDAAATSAARQSPAAPGGEIKAPPTGQRTMAAGQANSAKAKTPPADPINAVLSNPPPR
jgi:hypothetical protein